MSEILRKVSRPSVFLQKKKKKKKKKFPSPRFLKKKKKKKKKENQLSVKTIYSDDEKCREC